jgi:hypothetical protein
LALEYQSRLEYLYHPNLTRQRMYDSNGEGVLALYMQYVIVKIRSILAMADMSGDNAKQIMGNVGRPLAERSLIVRPKFPASATTAGVAERRSDGSSRLSFWEAGPDRPGLAL